MLRDSRLVAFLERLASLHCLVAVPRGTSYSWASATDGGLVWQAF